MNLKPMPFVGVDPSRPHVLIEYPVDESGTIQLPRNYGGNMNETYVHPDGGKISLDYLASSRTTKRSPEFNEAAKALAKAQGAMKPAIKDATNPFFKSKYADLASVWESCREVLSSNGFAVVQGASSIGSTVAVETTLFHESGQWVSSELTAIAADEKPQSIGGAVTYLRRYGLATLVGVVTEDDDGEAAQGRGAQGQQRQAAPARKIEMNDVKPRTSPDGGSPQPPRSAAASSPPSSGPIQTSPETEARITAGKRLWAIVTDLGLKGPKVKAPGYPEPVSTIIFNAEDLKLAAVNMFGDKLVDPIADGGQGHPFVVADAMSVDQITALADTLDMIRKRRVTDVAHAR